MKYQWLMILILALTGSGCKSNLEKPKETVVTDPHSFSRPEEVAVRHLSLHLKTDFENKRLSGKVILTIENKTGANQLILDTQKLTIEKTKADNSETSFSLGDNDPYLGQPLSIAINPNTKTVTVYYQTAPDAEALQWLSPEQTSGRRSPFLFTQSEATLARSWIPLQDSPGIRFTYDAEIECPRSLMAVMSAENDTVLHRNGIYHFNMPQPVPSYLMALAVGNLRYQAYDHRCGVYAEPQILDQAYYEFADMPAMIDSASMLYGDYRWGRYDVLVLPPSFPFGGMENPRLTFATPTVIAGDRSLTALIAHELAHSWSGNLVTNATWNDFWLNEGFTTYFESRIMEKIYGKPYADMLAAIADDDLLTTLKDLGSSSPDTRLKMDLKGRNPDDGMSDIAYEKGRLFLTLIEQTVGRKRWDHFLKNYFNTYAFQSMTTEKFRDYLYTNLLSKEDQDKIRTEQWMFEPGLPDNRPLTKSAELDKAAALARDFSDGKPIHTQNLSNWTTHHYLYFLRSLPENLTLEQMIKLDNLFHFNSSRNAEIRNQWLLLCISNHYEPAYSNLEEFLTTVGRRKFLRPLYSALAKTDSGKALALKIYKHARNGYHAVSITTIDQILNYKSATPD
ncbi:MAG: M1 family metallopeptidase [Bacteroidia bacterium]|nr:M1 family metallopeptidase [Bacteroidia bacterium]MCZ2278133.1 M1 family metallopeptidase [Bacteroidia bacterium]